LAANLPRRCRDNDLAGLRQASHSRRVAGRVADDLSCRIGHNKPSCKPGTNGETIRLRTGEAFRKNQRRVYGALRGMLLSDRMTEISKHFARDTMAYGSLMLGDNGGNLLAVGSDDRLKFLGIAGGAEAVAGQQLDAKSRDLPPVSLCRRRLGWTVGLGHRPDCPGLHLFHLGHKFVATSSNRNDQTRTLGVQLYLPA
jgi:hypothetical protein